jgi:YVTN family beta-propeller protein
MKSRSLWTVLGLVAVAVAAASGQWLEATVVIPDSFGGILQPNLLAYDSHDNRVFVAGATTHSVLALDATDGHRLFKIPSEGGVRALTYTATGNRLYWAAPEVDGVVVIDAASGLILDTVATGGYPVALAYGAALNRLYCLNCDGWSVTAIDCAGDSVVATVPVGRYPFGIGWNPTRNVVYAANTNDHTVSVIDAVTNTVVATIPSGRGPVGLVYNPDLNKLYVACGSVLTVIDGLADTVLATVPSVVATGLCYNAVNGKVYAAGGSWVNVIDCALDTVVRGIYFSGAADVAYNPLRNRVYTVGSEVASIDGATDSLLARIPFGSSGSAICVADSGRKAFATDKSDCEVGVVDCPDDSLIARVSTVARPSALCFNPARNKAYCADSSDDVVVVVDGGTLTVEAVVPVGAHPRALLYNPLGDKVYCASGGDQGVPATLSVIDGRTDSVLKTIATGVPGVTGAPSLCLNTTSNRVYVGSGADTALTVVDAFADEIVARAPAGGEPTALCYNPDYNYVYTAAGSGVGVVDCGPNTLIARLAFDRGVRALCYDPANAKVYCGVTDDNLVGIIAGRSPQLVAQVDIEDDPGALLWASKDNKIFCAGLYGEATVIDAAVDTVVASVSIGGEGVALSYDPLNDYVYCACRGWNDVYVIDALRDSVAASIGVGASPFALAWDPARMRTYVLNYASSDLSVIRDSLHVGVAEERPQASHRGPQATIVRGVLVLPRDMTGLAGNSDRAPRPTLLDVTGRRVMDLRAGANDISRLAPGVYFVLRAASGERQAAGATKVVIQR